LKTNILFYFEKRSSLLQRWRCSCKFKRIGSRLGYRAVEVFLPVNFHPDYESSGAKVVDKKAAFQSDIVLKVRAPSKEEAGLFRDEGTLYSFLYPAQVLISSSFRKNKFSDKLLLQNFA
jgi:hypothetical protein